MTKKPHTSSKWVQVKPKTNEKRRLTLFVAGPVPDGFLERLDKMTSRYDIVTAVCAGSEPGQEMSQTESLMQKWAESRFQNFRSIPWKDLGTFPGFMQFMHADGNRAVIAYDDGLDRADVKFAEFLGQDKDVQYRKFKIEPVHNNDAAEFTQAVNSIQNPIGISK